VLASIPEGGASSTTGRPHHRGLPYVDGASLLAETVEELNMMLQVRQAWADQSGFVFSVEKSKATVLAGTDPLELPSLAVCNEKLEWLG